MRRLLHRARIAGLLLLLLAPVFASAEEGDVFNTSDAYFILDDSLLLLNAEFQIELPEYIELAVDQGFAVPIMFEVEVLEEKKYWLDEKVISLKQQYLLHYLPMLNAYVIIDVNIGQRYYFDSRADAVMYLLAIYRYPMFDIENFSPDRVFYARLRIGIDTDELPLPLKSSSLWDNDWNLRSDWYEWGISQPQ